jgi:hypothetical protein
MGRVLELGMQGADVALLQRDLNRWYELWDAPGAERLDQDGDLGLKTELAFRRVRVRLGLEDQRRDGRVQISPRDRIVLRHMGRYLEARQERREYSVPASAHRTQEEIERGKASADYVKRLRERFREQREREQELRPEIVASVANQSSRRGLKPRIIVLHTTEGHNRPGLSDLRGLVDFFDNPRSQVSSHVANDAEGNDARIVPDEAKAWTQRAFNSVALSLEQIGHASQTTFPEAQLENTARWIAHWSKKWNIPIVHSTEHGVCQHRDLGPKGGAHHDCGPNYPFDRVLAMARSMA